MRPSPYGGTPSRAVHGGSPSSTPRRGRRRTLPSRGGSTRALCSNLKEQLWTATTVRPSDLGEDLHRPSCRADRRPGEAGLTAPRSRQVGLPPMHTPSAFPSVDASRSGEASRKGRWLTERGKLPTRFSRQLADVPVVGNVDEAPRAFVVTSMRPRGMPNSNRAWPGADAWRRKDIHGSVAADFQLSRPLAARRGALRRREDSTARHSWSPVVVCVARGRRRDGGGCRFRWRPPR